MKIKLTLSSSFPGAKYSELLTVLSSSIQANNVARITRVKERFAKLNSAVNKSVKGYDKMSLSSRLSDQQVLIEVYQSFLNNSRKISDTIRQLSSENDVTKTTTLLDDLRRAIDAMSYDYKSLEAYKKTVIEEDVHSI